MNTEMTMEKNYNPNIEKRIYDNWTEKGYFKASPDPKRKPYTIMMPPPNITGQLHMGHALTYTIQDILIRFKRMQGFNALWMPGTDHASISTELKIVDAMAKDGVRKSDIGREGFLKRAWEWRAEYGGRIVEQLKRIGSSCDWDRERFTMDEGLSRAVLENFMKLYEKGWIYRGEKLINWCTHCKTTISDAEVEHLDKDGHLYYFKYPVVSDDGTETGEFIHFATTRPETMLGDTAIAVNPKDERFTALLGKTVLIPVIGRRIPIIADEYVEMEFGTGAVKITPAHDPNDYEVGERHGLERINILNDDGTLNENAGKYQGMDRYDAREQLIKEMTELGLFTKTEGIKHAVGTHDRCHKVIEPMLKLQWFVKMDELGKMAADAYTNGDLRIVPSRFGKVYMNWLNNIRDWCISRQLWWGHRIPAYYCTKCGEVVVAREMPTSCKCGHTDSEGNPAFVQDEDCLDTWFSSALWPFSTLGWPDQTPELEYFYPTDVLVTGHEIIFFWVIRMMFSGLFHIGKVPFHDVMIHGIVRDSQGRKMSKSLGNGIDPLDVIDQYGTDALRLVLVCGNTLENDTRFYWEKLDTCRNFLNKVWNATRFLLMNFDADPELKLSELTTADKWILSRLNTVVKEATARMESYDLGNAIQLVYDFVWDEFCDWYIETAKPRLYDKEDKTRDAALATLKYVLVTALKLLHPVVPFITEEIFSYVNTGSNSDSAESIMVSEWPVYNESHAFPEAEHEMEMFKDAVKAIRNLRLEMNVPPAKRVKISIISTDHEVLGFFDGVKPFFRMLANVPEVNTGSDATSCVEAGDVSIVLPFATVYIPLEDLVDKEKELERLNKEKARLDAELARVNGKLGNEEFVRKAPQKIVDEEKAKREKYAEMLVKVEEALASLK